jgi:Uncharacterized protein conserved in bacteria (DUF2330)
VIKRALTVSLILGVTLLSWAFPGGVAAACGCGAYSPGAHGQASVPMESALVRWSGGRSEDVYLSLSVTSTVSTGALLFPVPDRNATAEAGPTDLFGDLDGLTSPPVTGRGPAQGSGRGPAQGPQVSVANRQVVGPLEVVTLSTTSPSALAAWLPAHGFAAKPALTGAAKPYTDQGWAFLAVRIRPGAGQTAALRGRLDPLHVHFATTTPNYPMRLSAMASQPEQVRLYALAPGRMTLSTATPGMRMTWSSRIGPTTGGTGIRKILTGSATFLTRFDGVLQPRSIVDDFHFSEAPGSEAAGSTGSTADAPFAAGYGSRAGTNWLLVASIAGAALVLIVVVTVAERRRRAENAQSTGRSW